MEGVKWVLDLTWGDWKGDWRRRKWRDAKRDWKLNGDVGKSGLEGSKVEGRKEREKGLGHKMER